MKVRIYLHKEDPTAVTPKVAYNGSSAAFDITATKTVTIPAKGSAVIPNGLRLVIPEDEPYYMMITLRSSAGFKKDLIAHPGIIDAGYTGNLGIKVYNLGDEDVTIEKGKRFAQIIVLPKFNIVFEELDKGEFRMLEESQSRGSRGFGSSGKAV